MKEGGAGAQADLPGEGTVASKHGRITALSPWVGLIRRTKIRTEKGREGARLLLSASGPCLKEGVKDRPRPVCLGREEGKKGDHGVAEQGERRRR